MGCVTAYFYLISLNLTIYASYNNISNEEILPRKSVLKIGVFVKEIWYGKGCIGRSLWRSGSGLCIW